MLEDRTEAWQFLNYMVTIPCLSVQFVLYVSGLNYFFFIKPDDLLVLMLSISKKTSALLNLIKRNVRFSSSYKINKNK